MTCKRARPIQNPVRLLHLCTYMKTEALKTCQKGPKDKKGTKHIKTSTQTRHQVLFGFV